MDAFIAKYGYWAVLFGSMIEGESIILTASALAAMKKLNIITVALITFMGTCIADQMIFFLGRFLGPRLLHIVSHRFPSTQVHITRALSFLKRHETAYIMTFRFIYGIRIISPFIIGSQDIAFKRFFVLNVISGLVWTLISCSAGFYLGKWINDRFGEANIAYVIFGVLVIVFFVLWVIKKIVSIIRKRRQP